MKLSFALLVLVSVFNTSSANALSRPESPLGDTDRILHKAGLASDEARNDLAMRSYLAGCMMAKTDQGMAIGEAATFCMNLLETTFKVSR